MCIGRAESFVVLWNKTATIYRFHDRELNSDFAQKRILMEFLDFFICIRIERAKDARIVEESKIKDSYDRSISTLHDELYIMSSDKDVLKIH